MYVTIYFDDLKIFYTASNISDAVNLEKIINSLGKWALLENL